ncbi:MAG: DNA mismatch repair protein MutS [Bdellovibrionaceae bacterium]|nr:DNA mismatch repair protein MutS [Pseudobdellovibrionaceae bacterium]
MEQYWAAKNQHADKVILFRMGDFFEMFHEDARIAAPLLNIALTQRNKKSKDDTPMCGMPHHSIAGPIGKLLAAGHKVAICDQIEDPKLAQGLVKRAVTRVLTPGMVYDPESLDQLEANYLCSYNQNDISFLDVSTGDAFYYELDSSDEYKKFIQLLKPMEMVYEDHAQKAQFISDNLVEKTHHSVFNQEQVSTHILPQQPKDLPASARLLLNYTASMQGEGTVSSFRAFEKKSHKNTLGLNSRVISHLEIFKTYKGDLKGSLFFSINRTKTSTGARLLKNWLQFPLVNTVDIEKRQKEVSYWKSDVARLKKFREVYSRLGDIERRLSKIGLPTCHPRDLLALSQSLGAGVMATSMKVNQKINTESAENIIGLVDQAISEEPPAQIKNGGFIKKGYFPELDEYIVLAEESQRLLVNMEMSEKNKTQIPSLKIRYNNVFGYYIEVTNVHKSKVPDHYKRKQTLANAERYVTQDLHELETKILSAKTKRLELENEIFKQVKNEIIKVAADLLELSYIWSQWDVLSAFAWLSLEQNYVTPSFSTQGELDLVSSRHPVVEQEVCKNFVPNDVCMQKGECFLLTGPNMAGKSTIMRQVAVTVLLAQVGADVPAKKASLPLYTKIFTRIGASDHLSEGLSTFMVEMVETAELLQSCDEDTLIVLDEIGRGTSTFDGMSLAQAILEYIVTEKRSMTLFATHYHELTQLSHRYKLVKNVHMAIKEDQKSSELTFLYTLLSGPANDSYGIQVAQLAGLPITIVKRAQVLLRELEKKRPDIGKQKQLDFMDVMAVTTEIPVSAPALSDEMLELVQQIKKTPIQQMTPLEALNKISKWQQDLS